MCVSDNEHYYENNIIRVLFLVANTEEQMMANGTRLHLAHTSQQAA